ncbi:MAG: class I SAM-dependent methyltransferase [Chitinivibrionales bacterium]|nr:class I SAM-dependent methyltransferase [Chitinivibrionales bacterium]
MEINLEQVGCDLCGQTGNTRVILPAGAPTELPEPCYIVRCNSCGMLYTNPRPDERSITLLYRKYYESTERKTSVGAAKKLIKNKPWLRRLWHAYNGQYLSEVLQKARGTVLDVGCGTGGLLDELAKKGCSTFGIELNPDSVKTCRCKGLDVRCGDLSNIDFPDRTFDTVILWHVLEHVPSPAATLRKIERILKPGGRLFINVPNAESYARKLFGKYWVAWHVPFHFSHFKIKTIQKYAVQAGFPVISCKSATPEYFIPRSIKLFLNRKKDFNQSGLILIIVFSLPFRLALALLLRLLDLLFWGGGESLNIELSKGPPPA